ncbi:hypothetical protein U1Q18_020657 [Sarracenia purpurea var. burkii]
MKYLDLVPTLLQQWCFDTYVAYWICFGPHSRKHLFSGCLLPWLQQGCFGTYPSCMFELWVDPRDAWPAAIFTDLANDLLCLLPFFHGYSDSAAPWLRLHVVLLKIENLFVLA